MAYRALYRKYRPQRFADIVGQPGIVQALSGQVASGRISHAYLFSGPRGTGKTTAAKVLARAINCADPQQGDACSRCKPCVELMGEANMDVIEIDAASNNSVDKVREMLDNVKYMPAVGRFRVYIVDEVHMLSVSAFNALLKTLEEPPAHVVFILATTEPHKLPPTVLSRCQQFQFRRIGAKEMTGLLNGVLEKEGATADREAVEAIARASDGGMRDALSLLDQCLSLNGSHVAKAQVLEMLGTSDSGFFYDTAGCLLAGDAAGAVEQLGRFLDSGGDIKTFAVDLCRHMRDLFIASYVKDGSAALEISQDEAARLSEQARRHAPGDILKCLGFLSELEGTLRYAANPRILVELALFRCCRVEKEASYDALLARVERLEARVESGVAPAPRPRQEAPAEQRSAREPAPQPAAQPEARQALKPDSLPEIPWFETEPEPQPAPKPAQAKPQEYFASPFDEEDGFPEPPPENLPGQTDLFGAVEPAPARSRTAPVSSSPPWDEPPAQREAPAREEPAPAPSPIAPSGTMPPAKLWAAVLREMEKQPQLMGFVKKGKAVSFDGEELVVQFTEDSKAAATMLSEEKRMAKLRAAVEAVAGCPVRVTLRVNRWSDAQQQFIDRSMAVIPKDAIVTFEQED